MEGTVEADAAGRQCGPGLLWCIRRWPPQGVLEVGRQRRILKRRWVDVTPSEMKPSFEALSFRSGMRPGSWDPWSVDSVEPWMLGVRTGRLREEG